MVTGGKGWYQEEGKPAQELNPRDVIKIPASVKHWHGAAKDSWFVYLSVETNPKKGPAVWLEFVSDEKCSKLK